MSNKFPLLRYSDLRALREQSKETLAIWYCKLNCFEWVDELSDPEPATFVRDKTVDRRGAIMTWIKNNIDDDYISAAWAQRNNLDFESVKNARNKFRGL